MELPPLPALKPDGNGGYTFCPTCAKFWLSAIAVIAVLGIAFYFYKKKGGTEENGR